MLKFFCETYKNTYKCKSSKILSRCSYNEKFDENKRSPLLHYFLYGWCSKHGCQYYLKPLTNLSIQCCELYEEDKFVSFYQMI